MDAAAENDYFSQELGWGMHYIAIRIDRVDSLPVRLAHRAAHLDFLRANAATIRVCGPQLAGDSATMTGSLLIIDVHDRKAGLFESAEVRPLRWAVCEPVA